MCGIVLKANFDGTPANNAVLEQYDKQSHRGKKGFGLFTMHEGRHQIVREADEDAILDWLCTKDSPFIMFHHRLPTSTKNVRQAAHPHSTRDYFGTTQYILVHNGIIQNADELFVAHQELGIEYYSFLSDLTFNDSEALLWDLALTLEGKQEKMKARGGMAFIILKTVDGNLDRIYFGRNDRPLNMYCDKQTLELSSEGRGVAVSTNTLYDWEWSTKRFYVRDMEFPSYSFQPKNIPTSTVNHTSTVKPSSVERREFNTYDEYWQERQDAAKAQSNWERLRQRYAHLVKKDKPTVFATESGATRVAEVLTGGGQSYEAQRNTDGTFTVMPKPQLDMDDIMSHKQDYEPTPAEIQRRAMEYLVEAQGVFENAYALLEFEYEQFLEDMELSQQTFEDVREQLLMEAALEWINKDPEYINENSVSSVAEAIYLQQEYAGHTEINGGQNGQLALA